MFIRRSVIIYSLLLVSLLGSAQNFVTLNWQELPPVQTLPSVKEDLPLGKNFRSYSYHVRIEYPEFQPVGEREAAELSALQVSLPDMPTPDTQLTISAHQGFLTVSFVPVVFRDGKFQRLLSYKLSLVRTPGESRTTRAGGFAESSILSEGRFVKIRLRNDGVYRITYAELRKMGFTNPEKVRLYGYGGYLLSQKFAEHPADDLPQAPLYHTGNSVLLYGRGALSWKPDAAMTHFVHEQNFYSEYGYYFLTEGEESPVEFPSEPSLPAVANPVTSFDAFSLYEKDAFSWAPTGRELYEDYDYSAGNTRQYNFTLPGIMSDAGIIVTDFSARSVGQSTSYSVSVDGTELGRQSVAGITSNNQYYTKATSAQTRYSWEGEKSEKTTVTINHNRSTGVSGHLNYITLNYRRALTLNEPFVTFRSLGSVNKETTFVLSGADASTVVWDITSPTAYKQMDGTLDGDKFIFTIQAGTLREFVAVNTAATFESIETVGEVPNQNLHSLQGIDMIILVPDRKGFIAQAERLAQVHRERDGLTVQTVTSSQVYNEFSSGVPDATAYRRLMKMLYDRSTSDADMPKYLLLFGDCSYDNRMLTSYWSKFKPSDFLLCYQSENSLNEINSYVTDDYFGFLDDDEGEDLAVAKVDIGIGRFPVRTDEEAKITVDKTIAYMENKEIGPWKHAICFAADDGDNNLHIDQAETLAAYTEKNHPSFLVTRLYEDAFKREATATGYTYKEATKQLLNLFEKGMLVVNYTGHGSTSAWSAENLLTADDITKLNSPRLPLWITATCDFTRFDDINTSAGEMAFLNPKGGAIALLTTSRVVYASQNSTLNQAFIKHLFDKSGSKRLRLGDIMRLSKCDISLANDRNKLNFSLIGDPALTLAYPNYRVKIDEFNGPLSDEFPMIKAGGKVTVKGHILTPEGEIAHDFNGTIHPTVLDSEEMVTTLDNSDEGPYTYRQRSKVLFSGIETVTDGYFEFTFPVPLDINYSNEQGLMNIYAIDAVANKEAGSYFDSFLVGGTDDGISTDIDGPEITVYLNDPAFQPGDIVNETPFFVANLEDPDGINTVGTGIGHDLTLIIDGDPTRTYSLNDYFIPEPGDYTRGAVQFSIPELAVGKHTLFFRAWDLLNNSSTKEVEFEVVRGLRPGLLSVTCTHSPARESTTFVLSHNRMGSLLDITLTVYDYSGCPLWVHAEQGASAGDQYYIEWDLCSSAGQRLMPGVYIYHATIASGGSKNSAKSGKIIILAQ